MTRSATAAVTGPQPEVELPAGLRLTAWRQDDAAAFVLAQRDPLVRHYAGRLVEDRAAALVAVHRYTASWQDGNGPEWAVRDRTGRLVGAVGFRLIDAHLARGMVGYWMLPEARGLGATTAAVLAGTRLVFGTLGWHRVELWHAVENERSCAVARRCGYRLEGTARHGMRYPEGERWSDEHVHARLVDDPDPLER